MSSLIFEFQELFGFREQNRETLAHRFTGWTSLHSTFSEILYFQKLKYLFTIKGF
jgi:hypothetical protein